MCTHVHLCGEDVGSTILGSILGSLLIGPLHMCSGTEETTVPLFAGISVQGPGPLAYHPFRPYMGVSQALWVHVPNN